MHRLAVFLVLVAVACGGGGDGDAPDAGPSNNNNNDDGTCAEGYFSDGNRLLPYSVGNSWRYRVQEIGATEVTNKTQELTQEMTPQGATEPVIVQVTVKSSGSTENWTRVVDDAVLRYQQIDRDLNDALEATTIYGPSRIRLDEDPARIADGAQWTENYTKSVSDENGIEVSNLSVVDEWEVIGTDVECTSPLGTFTCLQIRRTRTQGGVAVKDFWFARGIGKIREEGANQTEELVDCDLN